MHHLPIPTIFRRRGFIRACLVLCCGLAEPLSAAEPAFAPGAPWKDESGKIINAHGYCILKQGDTYHWYGSHKIEGRNESQKNEAGVRCYTSRDLLTWKDAGMVFDASSPEMPAEIRDAGIIDRPKVIRLKDNGRFVLYFKLYPPGAAGGGTGTNVAYVGVASSEQATGPFRYEGKFLGANSESGSGDFAIFQDEDGSVHHIAVQKPGKDLFCGRLTADGLRPEGTYLRMEGVDHATEAPALFRRNGKYHLLGSASTGWKPNPARWFVADRLCGPYQSMGNPCQGVNPHNGLGPNKTFGGQSTFVLKVDGKPDAWIAMFDIWLPDDPVNSGYIWLPLSFDGEKPLIEWRTSWNLSVFEKR